MKRKAICAYGGGKRKNLSVYLPIVKAWLRPTAAYTHMEHTQRGHLGQERVERKESL